MKCYKITKLVYIIVNVDMKVMLYLKACLSSACLSKNGLQY